MKFFETIFSWMGYKKHLTAQKLRIKLKFNTKKKIENLPPQKIDVDKPITYLLNDPTTPYLIKKILPLTPISNPKYYVSGYSGGGHGIDSLEGKAANIFTTMTNSISMVNKNSNKPLPDWPGTDILIAVPTAGEDLNAFYNRLSLQFFYGKSATTNTEVFTADSSEIVAHELGHAVLDSFRPDTWNAASLEVWSFHEAFADMFSVLSLMQHEEIIEFVLEETGGDLKKHNVVSSIGEQFGAVIFDITKGKYGRKVEWLRTAINDFKYVDPNGLPEKGRYDQITAECHSFGRIFLGALYDILVMIYHENVTSKGQLQALKEARDTMCRYLLKAIQNAPLNTKFYESVARTLLWVDWNTPDKKYHNKMRNIFIDRNLISSEIKMLSSTVPDDDNIEHLEGLSIVRKNNVGKLSEYLPIRAQSNNPLYNVNIDLVQEDGYFLDNQGNIIDMIETSQKESIVNAQGMIEFLYESENFDIDDSKPFKIDNNKLVRNYFN